jgi:hypothetical protein
LFLAPWFLLGLLAVSIPLAIHLRRATHQQRIVFSTTRFFDESFVRAARKAKLQDRALMLLRMALLALFALALAQPLLRLPGLGALASLAGGGRTVILVLDDSASMGVAESQGTLLDQARTAAHQVLDTLSPRAGDRAAIVLAGRRQAGALAPLPQPTGDLAALRKALDAVTVQDLAGDLDAALLTARQLLGRDAGAGAAGDEILVFSDLQAGGVPAQLDLRPSDAPVLFVKLRVDAAAAENLAIPSISRGAARAMVHVPFTFRALVQNHGQSLRSAEARLVIAGQVVGSRTLDLPPGRERIIRFTHRFTEPGWASGAIELVPAGPDAVAADNRRCFAVHVADHIRVLAINGAPSQVASGDELFFFRLALTAAEPQDAGRITLATAAPDRLAPESLRDADVVVLANVGDLSDAALAALEQYVDAGGSLLVTLGDRVQPQAVARWSAPTRLHGGLLPATVGSRREGEPVGILAVAADHPALAGLDDPQSGGLSAAAVRSWFSLQAPPQNVLITTATDEPLLVEKAFGGGRVMLLATSLDRDWNDLPLQPGFVPLVHRLVGDLARAELSAGFASTGQRVTLPTASTRLEALRIQTPDGGTLYPQSGSDATAAPTLLFDVPGRIGVYAVHPVAGDIHQPPRLLLAANLPQDEASTQYLDREQLSASIAGGAPWSWMEVEPGSDVAQRTQQARRGWGVWNQLLMLALLAAMFEPLLANRLAQRKARSGKVA